MTKHRKPPAIWLSLHSGDQVNTTIPFHKVQTYVQEMESQGYEIVTHETVNGYRIECLKSPHDRPKPPKLKLVKG